MPNPQELEQFLSGLRQHESGGRNIPNQSGSSASGYYQYVDGTWNDYGGYDRAIDAPFEVQHQRAAEDASRAYDRYGSWDQVAVNHFYPAWADQPGKWDRSPTGGAYNNPSVNDYVSSVLGSTGLSGGGQGGGGGGFTMPEVGSYPTTPPPLGRSDLQEFGQRRRDASRALQEALARAGHGREKIDSAFEQFTNSLERERGRTQRDTMQQLGGRGTARTPRFGGRALVDIRDEFAERRAEGESMRADKLGALDEMVREARTSRDQTLTDIEADKARRRTGLDQLIRQVGG